MANSETLIDTPFVLLQYYPRTKIVHHEIRQYIHGEAFRSLLDRGYEVVRTRGAKKWLSDDRRNGPLTAADADWATTDWAPRMIAAGWKAWAVVMPEKVLGQMNMKRWIELYAAQGVAAQPFTDLEEAHKWLEAERC